MEPLTFFFDGVDNGSSSSDAFTKDPLFESKVVGLLRQYLLQAEGGLSLAHTAQSIIALLPDPPEPRGWSEELVVLWELCLTAAEQIPYYHVCQTKLARLVATLRRCPKTTKTVIWVSICIHTRVLMIVSDIVAKHFAGYIQRHSLHIGVKSPWRDSSRVV